METLWAKCDRYPPMADSAAGTQQQRRGQATGTKWWPVPTLYFRHRTNRMGPKPLRSLQGPYPKSPAPPPQPNQPPPAPPRRKACPIQRCSELALSTAEGASSERSRREPYPVPGLLITPRTGEQACVAGTALVGRFPNPRVTTLPPSPMPKPSPAYSLVPYISPLPSPLHHAMIAPLRLRRGTSGYMRETACAGPAVKRRSL